MFLSIIIPVYNAQDTLPKCLDSIWGQGLSEGDFEVICVDDCSTDNSCEYIKGQKSFHRNLVLIKNLTKKRAGGARNEGVKAAKGEYVVFIDSDDYYHPDSLRQMVELQKRKKYDILMANSSREMFGRPSNLGVHSNNETVYSGRDFMLNNALPNSPWKYIFKRSLMVDNNIWFEECVAAEDIDWIFKLTLEAQCVRYVNILLVHYVINPQGQTQRITVKNIHDTCKAAIRLQDLSHLYDEQISNLILQHAKVYFVAAVKRMCRFFAFVGVKSHIIKEYFNSVDTRILATSKILNGVKTHPLLFSIASNILVLPVNLYCKIKSV